MAEVPIAEAVTIRPGDHLIVRYEDDLTAEEAERIKEYVRTRLPLLSDVTVIQANGLFVFREEPDG